MKLQHYEINAGVALCRATHEAFLVDVRTPGEFHSGHIPGVQGPADEAVQALLAGTLAYDPDTVCAHHHSGHEEGHTCAHGGENGCQHGSCGA